MDDLSVTLIVKAPNQQIEDQIINCEVSWTIKKLKTYLSEVYPSKPGVQDQKLIYSGQLLADSLILKDILRSYEGQENNTFHLVCTPSKYYHYTKSPVKTNQRTPAPSTSSASSASTSGETSNTTPKMKCDAKTQIKSNDSSSTSVKHTSIGASTSREQPNSSIKTPETSTSHLTGNAVEGNQVPNSTMLYSMDNQVYAAQLAMFQQNYINYLNQYMKMYVNQMQNIETNKIVNGHIPDVSGNNQVEENRVPPVADAVAARAPEPIQNVNAPEQDEGIIDRDWLDWFYVLSRLTVLLSIVYFYSSPLRFIIVFLLGCTMYLYQIGFFRIPLENNNAILNNNLDPIVENNNNRRNDAQREQQPLRDNPLPGGHLNPASAPSQAPIQVVPDRPTVLGVMWTFFTTFFASLIPEIPNAI